MTPSILVPAMESNDTRPISPSLTGVVEDEMRCMTGRARVFAKEKPVFIELLEEEDLGPGIPNRFEVASDMTSSHL